MNSKRKKKEATVASCYQWPEERKQGAGEALNGGGPSPETRGGLGCIGGLWCGVKMIGDDDRGLQSCQEQSG